MFVWSRVNNTYSFEQITYFEPYYIMHNGFKDLAYTQDFTTVNIDIIKTDTGNEYKFNNVKFNDNLAVGNDYQNVFVFSSPNGFVYVEKTKFEGTVENCRVVNNKQIICCIGKFYILENNIEYKFSDEYRNYKVFDVLFYKNSYYFVLYGNKTVIASTTDFVNFNYVEVLNSDNYPLCFEMNEDQMVLLSKNKNLPGRTTISYSNDGLSWSKLVQRNDFDSCYFYNKCWIFAGYKDNTGLIARMPLIISSEGSLIYDDIESGKLTNVVYLNNRLFVYGSNDLFYMDVYE